MTCKLIYFVIMILYYIFHKQTLPHWKNKVNPLKTRHFSAVYTVVSPVYRMVFEIAVLYTNTLNTYSFISMGSV